MCGTSPVSKSIVFDVVALMCDERLVLTSAVTKVAVFNAYVCAMDVNVSFFNG